MKAPPGARQESYLAAFDPVTGKRQWSVPAATWLLASVLATAGDLVLTVGAGDVDRAAPLVLEALA